MDNRWGSMTLSEAIDVLKKEKTQIESYSKNSIFNTQHQQFIDAVDVICNFIDEVIDTIGSNKHIL